MPKSTDPKSIREELYSTGELLNIRKAFNRLGTRTQSPAKCIINRIKIRQGRALDCGCGEGKLFKDLRSNGFVGELHGFDISPGMIKKARETSAGIDFFVGDIQQLEFANEFFDVITAQHMLYHVPDVKKALAEVYRCLKTGGKFIATLNSVYNKPKFHEIEKMLQEKYRQHTVHGQEILSAEDCIGLLGDFRTVEHTEYKNQVILDEPDTFVQYFNTFRLSWDSAPDDATWALMLDDVLTYAKREIEKQGKFVETNVFWAIEALK